MVDLLAARRKVADLARDLGVSDQTIYVWHRREAIDRGLVPGLTSVADGKLGKEADWPRAGDEDLTAAQGTGPLGGLEIDREGSAAKIARSRLAGPARGRSVPPRRGVVR